MNRSLIYTDGVPRIPFSWPKNHKILATALVMIFFIVLMIVMFKSRSPEMTDLDANVSYFMIIAIGVGLFALGWYDRQRWKSKNHDLNEILTFLHKNKDWQTFKQIKMGVDKNTTNSVRPLLEELIEGGYVKTSTKDGEITVYRVI